MSKKLLVLILVAVFVAAFAGSALAAPLFPVKWIAKYDGYVQMDWDEQAPPPGFPTALWADTLIVVNNANNAKTMPVWIEVYDKYGTLVGEQTLLNGGNLLENNLIPTNGYGWVSLADIIRRDTKDPWGFPAGEKFAFKISTGLLGTPPIVEVKQIIYNEPLTMLPAEAVWRADLMRTWAETVLGGLKGPGVIKVPKKMKW